MRIYLAASLFTQSERIWNRALAASIEKLCPGTTVMLPQDIKTKGDYSEAKNNAYLFARCVEGVDKADVLLAIMDGDEVDSGTAWEMGYAYAKGKPVIGVRTDFRPGADSGVNLMLSRSCRSIVREFAFQEDVVIVAKDIARKLNRIKIG